MNELKPCPFCGNQPVVGKYEPRLYRPVMNHTYCIVCCECEMMFGWDCDYGGRFDTEEEAIEAWNRRIDNAADRR